MFPPFRLSDSPGWTRCPSSVSLGYCLGCLHCTVMRVCPSHETMGCAEALTQESLCDSVEGVRCMKRPAQGSRGRAATGPTSQSWTVLSRSQGHLLVQLPRRRMTGRGDRAIP